MFLQDHETCKNFKIGNEYRKQIFIEPYVPLTAEQNTNKNLVISIMLHEIPNTITVQQKL